MLLALIIILILFIIFIFTVWFLLDPFSPSLRDYLNNKRWLLEGKKVVDPTISIISGVGTKTYIAYKGTSEKGIWISTGPKSGIIKFPTSTTEIRKNMDGSIMVSTKSNLLLGSPAILFSDYPPKKSIKLIPI